MKVIHLIVLLFFVSILLYLGLKNANGVATIFKAGSPAVNSLASTLQGR